MVLLPLMDVIAKHLTAYMASGQVVWSRMFFQTCFLLPLLWPIRNSLVVAQPHLFLLRGVLIATATLFFFTALAKLPVADALAIFFVEPLLLTILSVFFLEEKIGARRVTAVLIGFVGALIIIKPSAEVFGIYAVLPLGAAFCFAFYLIITRKLAQTHSAVIIQMYTGIAGIITISIALAIGTVADIPILQVSAPATNEWLFMVLLGAVACAGHLLLTQSFRYIDASVLAPFHYLEIVGAVVFGWIVFADKPALSACLGIFIIISSGIYVYYREQTTQQAKP